MQTKFGIFGPVHIAILSTIPVLAAILAALERWISAGGRGLRIGLAITLLLNSIVRYWTSSCAWLTHIPRPPPSGALRRDSVPHDRRPAYSQCDGLLWCRTGRDHGRDRSGKRCEVLTSLPRSRHFRPFFSNELHVPSGSTKESIASRFSGALAMVLSGIGKNRLRTLRAIVFAVLAAAAKLGRAGGWEKVAELLFTRFPIPD